MLCDVEGVYIVQSVHTDHTVFVGHGKRHRIYCVLRRHACQNIYEKLNLMDLRTLNFFFPSITLRWHYSFTDKVSNIVRIYLLTFCYRYSIMVSVGTSDSYSSSSHGGINNEMVWCHQLSLHSHPQSDTIMLPLHPLGVRCHALFTSVSTITHHHAPSPPPESTLSCSLRIWVLNLTPSCSFTSSSYIVLLSSHLRPQSDTITRPLHLQEVHHPAFFASTSTL